MSFTFIDLFAGIGGFHSALTNLGGNCIWASEKDVKAALVYELNWTLKPAGDINLFTDGVVSDEVPTHDVLTAGFPCQPFSKSGKQHGLNDKTRGTLFFNICQILEARKPAIVFLENVRNLAGPRHKETWATIVQELRSLGYMVSSTPTIFSPHLLPAEYGGAPQRRERVYIFGIFVGQKRAMAEMDEKPFVENRSIGESGPHAWNVNSVLNSDNEIENIEKYQLSDSEILWLNVWGEFITIIRGPGGKNTLPGFPIWADSFKHRLPPNYSDLPSWKVGFLRKNRDLYVAHKDEIDDWLIRWDFLEGFPVSRRKFEWQAQETASIWDCVIQFRPSGIRVKKPDYLPALVAINQTSVIGARKRRISPEEAMRLQGFPENFSFGLQSNSDSYKQLGNGISVGAASFVFWSGIKKYENDLRQIVPGLVESVLSEGSRFWSLESS